MRKAHFLIPAAAALVALTGCAAQEIVNEENALAAAGFQIRPANTPERQASLQSLPPHKLILTEHEGRPLWLYADPDHCHCLYVGDPEAHQRYAQIKVRQRIAETQLQAAQIQSMNFGWGFWGPWPPYGPVGLAPY